MAGKAPGKKKLNYADVKNLRDFNRFIKGKSVSIIGLGVSNKILPAFLREHGAGEITVRDKKEDIGIPLGGGVRTVCGEGYLEGLDEEVIFKTPGLRGDLPELTGARERGAALTCEMELFLKLCPARVTAVTGSEGKTTTTTLISRILAAAGRKVWLGGNIGTPLLPYIKEIKEGDEVCVELSSFQLTDLAEAPAPNCAVVTNVTPNHLDWHTDMAEYIAAKRNIFKNQSAADRLALSYDNEVTRSFGEGAAGEVWYFSKGRIDKKYDNAVFSEGGNIILRTGGKETKVMPVSDILIPGGHNALNYMAASAAVWGRADAEAISRTARSFGGVEHRNELVRELDGVKYYNSSMDSSPSRTCAFIDSFPSDTRLVIILGGYDKKIPFEPLAAPVLARARAAVLCGATAGKIREALTTHPSFGSSGVELVEAADYEEAVASARSLARPGDAVLLSPACASFDMFINFEERGNTFKRLVGEL